MHFHADHYFPITGYTGNEAFCVWYACINKAHGLYCRQDLDSDDLGEFEGRGKRSRGLCCVQNSKLGGFFALPMIAADGSRDMRILSNRLDQKITERCAFGAK